jgi:hypothetical protein
MAMDLDAAKTEIQTAIKTAMMTKYGADVKEADMVKLAEGLAPGVVAALQHILDRAVTATGGERIK